MISIYSIKLSFITIITLMLIYNISVQNISILNFYMGENIMTITNTITSIQTNHLQIFYMVIVSVVTILVLTYSENYINSYNNNNFFCLLLSFFLSIIILTSSKSNIMIMVGWEFLGITSVCLILFYPNINSNINSFLTIFYNRIGDVLLITILALSVINSWDQILENLLEPNYLYMLIICSITNSAQIPLASWLPAAISAPTPISAIVHSSTLVTAGIYIIILMQENLISVISIINWISITSFFVGGLISVIEIDYNNIIAFSTIGQISIIITMNSIGINNIALTHIIYHAFFNTILFCSAGYIFLQNWGNQNYNNLSSISNENLLNLIIWTSIFGITGLIYSNSFFSNDCFLESSIQSTNSNIITAIILISAIITIIYSINLLNISSNNSNSINYENSNIASFTITASLLLITSVNNIIESSNFFPFTPYLNSEEYIFLLIAIIVLALTSNSLNLGNEAINLNIEILASNIITFSSVGYYCINLNPLTWISSDILSIKSIWMIPNINKIIVTNNIWFLIISITICTI